jgi:hypothetical protein
MLYPLNLIKRDMKKTGESLEKHLNFQQLMEDKKLSLLSAGIKITL